jgi:hypothetical protein
MAKIYGNTTTTPIRPDLLGGGNVTVDQTYTPNSLNAQSGIAVAQALSGKLDKQKNYELIATIKVTPDVDGNLPTSIVFTQDSNGNSFELTDFCISMLIGATDGSNAKVVLTVNDLMVFGNATLYLTTGLSAWYLDYIDLGACKLCIAPAQANGTVAIPNFNINTFKGALVPSILPSGYNYSPVRKIRFYLTGGTEKTFVEGSEFKLYGVRK